MALWPLVLPGEVPRSGIKSLSSWQSPFCCGSAGIPFRVRKSDETLFLLPFYRICLLFPVEAGLALWTYLLSFQFLENYFLPL